MVDRIDNSGRLIAAVHHAIGAFLVIAGAVRIPVGLLHQLPEGFRIAFAEQIARALPAEVIARRVAPRGAAVGLVAGEEIEEQARLVERPATPALALGIAPEDLAKQLLGAPAVEEMRLIGGALI